MLITAMIGQVGGFTAGGRGIDIEGAAPSGCLPLSVRPAIVHAVYILLIFAPCLPV
jgi:hypothetical protein